MPKMKTHSGAKKRFKVTGSGKVMREQAGQRHLLEDKSSHAHPPTRAGRPDCRPADTDKVKKLLGSRADPTPYDGAPMRRWHPRRSTHVARVKRAVNAQKKRRAVLEQASGYRGQRSRLYRKAKEQMPTRWSTPTATARTARATSASCGSSASTRRPAANGMTYNRFIQGLKAAGVEVDRKILAELAVNDAAAFAALVEVARAALPASDAGLTAAVSATRHRSSPATASAWRLPS